MDAQNIECATATPLQQIYTNTNFPIQVGASYVISGTPTTYVSQLTPALHGITIDANGVKNWTNRTIKHYGELVVDVPFVMTNCILMVLKSESFSITKIGPIRVQNRFTSSNSKFFAKLNGVPWKGIELSGNGELTFSGNNIEDAEVAINITGQNTKSVIVQNCFNRNGRGILAVGIKVNGFILNNSFSKSAPLMYELGNSPTGINFTGVPGASIGIVGPFKNAFNDLSNGIFMHNSTVFVGFNEFFRNNEAVSANISNLTMSGFGASVRSLFSENESDVLTTGSNLDMKYCHMEKTKKRTIFCDKNDGMQLIKIYNNSFDILGNHQFLESIYVDRPKGSQTPTSINRVEFIENYPIIQQTFGHDVNKIVFKLKGKPAVDRVSVSKNRITFGTGGNNQYSAGIALDAILGGENYSIFDNKITSINPGGGFVNDPHGNWRWLIAAFGNSTTKGNFISFNELNLQNILDNGGCGIHTKDMVGTEYCDNKMDLLYKGLHLAGNVAPVRIVKNKIDHLDYGMHLETSGFGLQHCMANEFNPNHGYAVFGALSEGAPVLTNNFWTDPTKNNIQIPPSQSQSPGTLFTSHPSCENITPTCGSGTGTGNEGLTAGESSFISESLQHFPTETAKTWQKKREIFYKFINSPALKTATPENETYYNLYKNTSAHLFAKMDSLIAKGTLIPTILGAALTQNQSNINSLLLQLDLIDRTFDQSVDGINFNTNFWTTKQSILDNLEPLHNDLNNLRVEVAQFNATIYPIAGSFNQTLPTESTWTSLQKEVFGYYFHYVQGMGFSEAELNQLRTIAAECPEIAGKSIEMAIGLLPSEEQSIYLKEDMGEYECGSSPKTSGNFEPELPLSFSISPNPINDKCLLSFGNQMFSGTIMVFDISGRPVFSQNVEGVYQLEISSISWPNGVYVVKVNYPNGSVKSAKIIR